MQESTRSEFRLERKYILSTEQTLAFDQLIQLNPAHFKPAFHPRYINNVYFDTTDFAHFRENVAGVSPRRKVRVRWYDAFEDEHSAALEIKSKIGEVVGKFVSPITFSLQDNFSHLAAQVSQQKQPDAVSKILLAPTTSYAPVLTNRYLRTYFISASGKVRLTLDKELFFGKADSTLQTPTRRVPYTVVELKYAQEDELEAADIASQFPFRLGKSSKYQQGVALCYPHMVIL